MAAVLWSEWVWQQILMTGINSNWRMLALQTLQQSLSTRSVTNSDTHCSQPRLHNYNAPAMQSIQHLPFNDFSRSNRVEWASSCLFGFVLLIFPRCKLYSVQNTDDIILNVYGQRQDPELRRLIHPEPPSRSRWDPLPSLIHNLTSPASITSTSHLSQ